MIRPELQAFEMNSAEVKNPSPHNVRGMWHHWWHYPSSLGSLLSIIICCSFASLSRNQNSLKDHSLLVMTAAESSAWNMLAPWWTRGRKEGWKAASAAAQQSASQTEKYVFLGVVSIDDVNFGVRGRPIREEQPQLRCQWPRVREW